MHHATWSCNCCCRYAKEDGDLESLERDLNEETGWKLVHGDVFRPPQHRMLLAACVGTGVQLCLLGLFVILLTIMGTFYEVRMCSQSFQPSDLMVSVLILHKVQGTKWLVLQRQQLTHQAMIYC